MGRTDTRRPRNERTSARRDRLRPESRYERIYDFIRRIPAGRVATYGQIAALAGFPRHARQVGYALYALREHTTVPWHRVVNARGGLSLGKVIPEGDVEQRIRLEIEGVEFGPEGRIALERFQWRPRTFPRRRDRRRIRRGAPSGRR